MWPAPLGGVLPLRAFHLATWASLPGGGESTPWPSAASSASNSEQPVWITSASWLGLGLGLGLGLELGLGLGLGLVVVARLQSPPALVRLLELLHQPLSLHGRLRLRLRLSRHSHHS